jgi:hypothetical protein
VIVPENPEKEWDWITKSVAWRHILGLGRRLLPPRSSSEP